MLSADEMMGVKRSPHEERFMRELAAAVGQDQLTSTADHLGINHDPGNRDQSIDGRFYRTGTTPYAGYTL